MKNGLVIAFAGKPTDLRVYLRGLLIAALLSDKKQN